MKWFEFSPEDATRTELDFLLQVVQTAVDAGASYINIPDTVGFTTPEEYGAIFKHLIENVKTNRHIVYSPHCHDDLGMAVANSLAAVKNGAGRVEGTINGIGERAGNAALEEIAVALNIRQDYYQAETSIVLNETINTSEMVSRFSGIPVPKNKAVVGGNAFSHESGIHQDGVLKILLLMRLSPLNWLVLRVIVYRLENCLVAMPLLKNCMSWDWNSQKKTSSHYC